MQNEQATSTVIVNGEQAKQEMTALEQKARSLKEQLIAANKAGDGKAYDKLSKDLRKTQKEMKQLQKESFDVKRVLDNLSGASMKDLESAQKRLNAQLRSGDIRRNSKEWKENVEAQKKVRSEMKSINAEMQVGESRLSKFANGFNKYFASFTAGFAAVAGVTMSLKKFSDMRNELEDSKANLQALTGLNTEDIGWLNEQAKKMSVEMSANGVRIRQTSQEIVDAYTLVGSAKPELLENRDALKEVTEQTLILATAAKMDLKYAVEGITMAMNQYSASADEASRYTNVLAAGSKYGAANVESQTSAIIKSGVAAAQANIPIEQLVGTIQTLAEKGIKDEIAGTGLKKFFLTLQTGADDTNPKIVGLEKALDNMAKKQLSASEIKKLFGEEGYNVAAVLLSETERVKYFTDAVSDSNIALEQATINSNTLAAKLAQARNKLSETAMEFVGKLNPAMLTATNFGTKFIKVLVELPAWLKENKGLLISLTLALSAYTIALTRKTIAEKAGAIATKILNSATVTFFKTMLTNPYVAIGVAIAGFTTLIYKLITAKSQAKKAFSEFTVESEMERQSINSLFGALKKSNEGSEHRNRLIAEVNTKYSQYLPNLLSEKSSLEEINAAQKRVISGMREKIALQMRDALVGKQMQVRVQEQSNSLEKLRKRLSVQMGDRNADQLIENIKTFYDKYGNMPEKANEAVRKMFEKYNIKTNGGRAAGNLFGDTGSILTDFSSFHNSFVKMNSELAEADKRFSSFINTAKSGTEEVADQIKPGTQKFIDGELVEYDGKTWKKVPVRNPDDEKDPYKKALIINEINTKKELLVFQEMLRQKLISEKLYQELSSAQELIYLENKLKIQQKFKKDPIDTELEISNAKTKIEEDQIKNAEAHKKAIEEIMKLPSSEISEDEAIIDTTKYSLALRLAIVEKFHEKGLLSEREYLKKLADLYKGNQKEINEYLKDENLKHNQEEFDSGIIGRKQYLENVRNITKMYWEEIFADQSELANKVLAIANKASEFVKALSEAETLAVENKYAKQLDAARKNGEDTTALEEKIEEEKKQVKKKYADIDFAINVAKIIAETALAVMEAAPNIPLQILTGATGLAQIALANQERMAVKNLWTGGYTDPGGKYEPRGIVHAGEFVANQDSVKNSTLRRLFNLIDYAQKTNTVPRIDKELISRTIHDRGYSSGGFTSQPEKEFVQSTPDMVPLFNMLNENRNLMLTLIYILKKGIRAKVSVTGDGGLKDANDLYDELINNAQR